MGAMCAILSPGRPPDPASLQRMLAAAPHRGASCETSALQGPCLLGVARLDDGDEVWLGEEAGGACALVGPVDDVDRLVEEFDAEPGVDPALLVLRAVRAFGNAAPARLRGVFAAAVWDGTSLRCFRDQLG